MQLEIPGRPHLTYCSNIHPGEAWSEVKQNLERYFTDVKRRVSPESPFGIGLRLSDEASRALASAGELSRVKDWLDAEGLYVFTVNGFPFGRFHGARVKERVYRPDWLEEERLAYSNRLAGQLAALLPEHASGSVSTVPGAFRPRLQGPTDYETVATNLVRHAAVLYGIRERTGRLVELALEPEPCCMLETVDDTIRFFEQYLFARRWVALFRDLTGTHSSGAEPFLRRHLGVCFDACHMAVEFEEAAEAVARLSAAGIRIGKVQISAGLVADLTPDNREERLRALRSFSDEVYLHQVVELRNGELFRWADLDDAFRAAAAAPGAMTESEWRIHFHVPIFREGLSAFRSTQPFLRDLIEILAKKHVTDHLEVETYTWGVLPEDFRREPVADAVVRELEWIRSRVR